MKSKFERLPDKEAINAENSFLKIKMMLENGAHIGSTDDPSFTPEMENAFLRHVMAFEKQFEEGKTIKLFDKIDRPTIFKPVAEVEDSEMEGALDSILEWLAQYNITLDVFSPNITTRELYRFIMEELFEYEMDDMDVAGWTNNFIYDEFHPDPFYENENIADECIKVILSKASMELFPYFRKGNLALNEYNTVSKDEMQQYINIFKDASDEIECMNISGISCAVEGVRSAVTGHYQLRLVSNGREEFRKGKWRIELETPDNFFWYVYKIQIEGINF
ncbi:MAG: hypothetical protein H7258_02525 [Ferruginibacter sp.]|nr:hypothetical protein [Ferruginibacter sp.]